MPSSEVWKYFKKSEQNDLAKCDICGKELKLPGGGTITSLITHLMSLHKIILKRKSSESEDIKQMKYMVNRIWDMRNFAPSGGKRYPITTSIYSPMFGSF